MLRLVLSPQRLSPSRNVEEESIEVTGERGCGGGCEGAQEFKPNCSGKTTRIMIEGFVEAVETFQVRGWAYDTASPEKTLEIEILRGGEPVAQISANLFRQDLLDGKIGDGRHAFVYNFDAAQSSEAVSKVAARARTAKGWVALERLEMAPAPSPKRADVIAFDGVAVDPEQEPVFVLGAARSGTSAIAQALLKCGYEGHQEGHLFDLLAVWSVGLDKFFDDNRDDHTGGRDTMLSRFSLGYMNSALNEIFVRAARATYPTGRWIDKTPNSNMIFLAPRIRRIWPRARFIFMKRRFLENSVSRGAKFPTFDFAKNCREWAEAMNAWLGVRGAMSGVSIEIDQKFLAENPLACARGVGELLKWGETTVAQFSQALTHDWPERTSSRAGERPSVATLRWSEQQMEAYKSICAQPMYDYGYAEDERYFLDGGRGRGAGMLKI